MVSCCNHTRKHKKCIRKYDKKEFNLPRRFSKKRCINGPVSGFTMKSSCAPYKRCTLKGGKNKYKRKNLSLKKRKNKRSKYS